MLSSGLRFSIAAGVVALLAVAFTLSHPPQSAEAAVENLGGCTTSSLGPGDDSNPQTTPLTFTPNFFGQTYNQISVNNNGNVTFDGALTAFTPENLLQTNHVIIAPFWADVDTRGTGSGVVTYGNVQFNNRPAFCVNWVNVGYFGSHADKTNSFQLLLVDRSDVGAGDFDIVINYDQVQWETGDFNGGSGGLGGTSARMGYSNGVDVAFDYPGSGVNGAFLDSSSTGLARNSLNSTVTGRYIFAVRGGLPPGNGSVTGTVYGPAPNARAGVAGGLVPMANASVTACATPPCSSTTTNADGQFTVAGLNPGDYHVIAYPPAGRDDLLPADARTTVGTSQVDVGQLTMSVPEGPPPGSMIESIGSVGGAPVLDWSRNTDFSVVGCEGGSGTWNVKDTAGNTLASGLLTESPPGQYNGTIPPLSPYHGPVSINISIFDCPNPGDNIDFSFSAYIDPSGVVLDLQDNPVAGANVTLLRSDSAAGPFEAVNQGSNIMSPSNRTNADFTDELGGFHWDTIAGFYIVRAEKAGCHKPGEPLVPSNQTPVLPVPPPQLNLVIRLDCAGGPIGTDELWGDADCSGGINPIDSLKILRKDAGFSSATVQGGQCPGLNTSVLVNLVLRIWGDVDCSLIFNPVDALKTLRFDAGLSVPKNDPRCPDMGDLVTLGGATPAPTNTPTHSPTPSPTQGATTTPTPSSTGAATTPPVTASPTPPVQPILLCWIAIISNDIVNGFIDDEFCTADGGNTYNCSLPVDFDLNCNTLAQAGDYSCDADLEPTPCDSDGTAGYPDYSCEFFGLTEVCSTSSNAWPDYTCDASSEVFISCTTNHMNHPDFECNVSGLEYVCE